MRAGVLFLLSAIWACSPAHSLGDVDQSRADAATDAQAGSDESPPPVVDGAAVEVLGLPAADAAVADVGAAPAPTRELVFVVNHDSHDVSVFSVDLATNALAAVPGSPFAAGKYPNDGAITPDGRFLYVSDGDEGSVRVYAVGKTGALTPRGSLALIFVEGLLMSPSGRVLYARAAGSVYALEIDPETGALSRMLGTPIPNLREVNGLAIDPQGRFLMVATNSSMDLGDWIHVHPLASNGAPSATPASSLALPMAVRHGFPGLTFDPSGRFLYATGMRFTGEDLLLGYAVDAVTGRLTELPGSPWPAPDEARQIVFHPTKPLIYFGSQDILFVYQLGADGLLSLAQPGWTHNGASTGWRVSATGGVLYMLASLTGNLRAVDLGEPGFPQVTGSPWKTGDYPVAIVTWSR